ncbi:MAG: carboxypeptidase regulatory-like domain-containing protein [Polyangia bacterium]
MAKTPVYTALALTLALGCSGGSIGGSSSDGGSQVDGSCSGLQCQVVNCQDQGKPSTTLSGVVNIPAGNLPLYGASVYVPGVPEVPIVSGATCDRCDQSAASRAIAQTTTDINGRFTLRDVPAGSNIPLVIRLGKWRRQITLPAVTACADTPVEPTQTRLPRNQTEGDIPKIAVATGGYDAIECLLRKLGIEDREFTTESGTGRVNLFAGNGGTNRYAPSLGGAFFTVASDTGTPGWWSSLDNLKKYDTVILSCEGGTNPNEKSASARQALLDYINLGGRVFASHWHNIWISGGPGPLPSVATFRPLPGVEYNTTIEADINLGQPKGAALADWMVGVGGSTTRGKLSILKARNTVLTINDQLTERFVSYNDPMRGVVQQYFSFFAPIGASMGSQCGRMVFTDMHVSGNDAMSPDPNLDMSSPTLPFPNGCRTPTLTPQEKALLFLLFDLTNCVQPRIG